MTDNTHNNRHTDVITTRIYESPFGTLMLGSTGGRLCLCDWVESRHYEAVRRRLQRELGARFEAGNTATLETAAAQLDEYFGGKRTAFDVEPLFAGTEFQKRVWAELLKIPYAATISYATAARMTGNARAVRATASAVGANALSIFVPCHRVVGADGSITGYAGGIEAKRGLLDLESRLNEPGCR